MSTATPRVRRSITDIQADYDAGNTTELENLIRAWAGIKALPSTDPNSFFMLGGYHGEPFRGPGETDGAWWGGYCQHGTVLFPTWHRAYLLTLENALRSIPGCGDVTLPFWDECAADSQKSGIPHVLTDYYFYLPEGRIDNPLRSFKFPIAIVDQVQQDDHPGSPNPNLPNYSKPLGYETVRYPLSGLVGTPAAIAATNAHNANYSDYDTNVQILNANIVSWLTTSVPPLNPAYDLGMIVQCFQQAMDTPTYTLFSNTTSQGNWTNNNPGSTLKALETPHNFMHLAVGGYEVPQFDASPIDGANGDMGENDTAALDPIFFFHHCFIDYAFWTWQRRYNATQAFTIDPNDPGAAYIAQVGGNNQPPAGSQPSDKLGMDTQLLPFEIAPGTPYTSNDVVDIEGQLGYSYGPGSLDAYASTPPVALAAAAVAPPTGRSVHVAGLDRSKIAGSFLIAAYAGPEDNHRLLGVQPVLSRWDVVGCSNCQTRLKATADFALAEDIAESGAVKVLVHTRHGVLGDAPPGVKSTGLVLDSVEQIAAPFTVEIR